MGKDTKITMEVDTKKINENNVNQCVEFKDNQQNPNPSKNPAGFTSLIDKGHKVFWFGESKGETGDTIQILEIKRKKEDEPEFLEIKGKDPGHNGVYMAKVIDNYLEGEESYYVEFTINKTGPVYQVDPKLVMSQN